jgi:hypothetical protein
MEVFDYNAEGRWSRTEILARYASYAAEMGVVPRDLSPMEHSERGQHWVYPVMMTVIVGIEAGDAACVRLGIEFIEEDSKFPFGKTLKSNTARALRRAPLTEDQKQRIRRRVFGLLRAGHIPHEYREYARLVRKIGFSAEEVPEVHTTNPYVARFHLYFQEASRPNN